MKFVKLSPVALAVALSVTSSLASAAVPHTFEAGKPARANEVNANFEAVDGAAAAALSNAQSASDTANRAIQAAEANSTAHAELVTQAETNRKLAEQSAEAASAALETVEDAAAIAATANTSAATAADRAEQALLHANTAVAKAETATASVNTALAAAEGAADTANTAYDHAAALNDSVAAMQSQIDHLEQGADTTELLQRLDGVEREFFGAAFEGDPTLAETYENIVMASFDKLAKGRGERTVDCTHDPYAMKKAYMETLAYRDIILNISGACYGSMQSTYGAQLMGQTLTINGADETGQIVGSIIPDPSTGSTDIWGGFGGGLFVKNLEIDGNGGWAIAYSRNGQGGITNVTVTNGTIYVQSSAQVYLSNVIVNNDADGADFGLHARGNSAVRTWGEVKLQGRAAGLRLEEGALLRQHGPFTAEGVGGPSWDPSGEGNAIELNDNATWSARWGEVGTYAIGDVNLANGSVANVRELEVSGNLNNMMSQFISEGVLTVAGDIVSHGGTLQAKEGSTAKLHGIHSARVMLGEHDTVFDINGNIYLEGSELHLQQGRVSGETYLDASKLFSANSLFYLENDATLFVANGSVMHARGHDSDSSQIQGPMKVEHNSTLTTTSTLVMGDINVLRNASALLEHSLVQGVYSKQGSSIDAKHSEVSGNVIAHINSDIHLEQTLVMPGFTIESSGLLSMDKGTDLSGNDVNCYYRGIVAEYDGDGQLTSGEYNSGTVNCAL